VSLTGGEPPTYEEDARHFFFEGGGVKKAVLVLLRVYNPKVQRGSFCGTEKYDEIYDNQFCLIYNRFYRYQNYENVS